MAINGYDSDAPTEGSDTATPPHTSHDPQESFAHDLDYGTSTGSWRVGAAISLDDPFNFNAADVYTIPSAATAGAPTVIIPAGRGSNHTIIVDRDSSGTILSPTPVTVRGPFPITAGRYNASISLAQINFPNSFVFAVGIISEDLVTFVDLTPPGLITSALNIGPTTMKFQIDSFAAFGNGARFFPQFIYFDLHEVILNGLDFVDFFTL